MGKTAKLPVKWGLANLETEMTREGALRYGKKRMDKSLRRAGFVVEVSKTDPELHGGEWYRINVVKYY